MDLQKELPNLTIWKMILCLSGRVRKTVFLYVFFICLNRLSAFAIAYVFSMTLLDSTPNAVKYGGMFLTFKVLEWIFFLFQDRYFVRTRSILIEETSNIVFEKIMYLDFKETKGVTSVDLLKKADFKNYLRGFIGFSINHLTSYIIDVLASIFIIYKIGGNSVDFIAIILAITLVAILLAGKYIITPFTRNNNYQPNSGEKKKSIIEEIVINQNNLVKSTRDLFGKILVAKVFDAENLFLETRNKLAVKERKILNDFRHKAVKVYFVIFFICAISFSVLFFMAIERLHNGLLTKEVFAAIMLVVMSIYWKLQQTTYVFEDLVQYPVLLSFGFNILTDKSLKENNKILDDISKPNKLSFNNVSFNYGEKKVLDDISFSLHNDETLFLVGISGAGKSTIFKLLLSEEVPDCGSILWKDRNISDFEDVIAWVPQDTIINGGVADFNLSLGKGDASLEEKILALKKAKIHHRVNESNLDKVLDNKNMSGGEQQRFAIARAFLSNRPLMILDEPSSALNLALEKEIISEIVKIEGVIKIVIIHRILAIPDGYKVAVLDNGKIVEFGLSEDLAKKGGYFTKMLEEAKYDKN